MQAFVVTHDACSEVVESAEDGEENDEAEDEYLAGDGGKSGVYGAFEEVLFFHSWLGVVYKVRLLD